MEAVSTMSSEGFQVLDHTGLGRGVTARHWHLFLMQWEAPIRDF